LITASLKIEESLDISDEELGVLGSLVYAGIVVMGILAGPLFLRVSAKKLIIVSLLMMMLSLLVFTFRLPNVTFYLVVRFLTGVS
jgi:MFS transporter, Spinster family, sphingosine-1-phosphate transporter